MSEITTFYSDIDELIDTYAEKHGIRQEIVEVTKENVADDLLFHITDALCGTFYGSFAEYALTRKGLMERYYTFIKVNDRKDDMVAKADFLREIDGEGGEHVIFAGYYNGELRIVRLPNYDCDCD